MITRRCPHCNEAHQVYYYLFRDGSKHLTMKCPERKGQTYIPFEFLDIETCETKKRRKRKVEEKSDEKLF